MVSSTQIESGDGAGEVASDRPVSMLDCIDPATGEVFEELPIATPEDIRQAVRKAREAFPSWSQRSFAERAAFLLRARDILLDQAEEFVELLVRETGKTRFDATGAEIPNICEAIGYYTSHGARFLADESISTRLLKAKRLKTQYRPRGLVLNISPWNFPLDLAWSPLVSALLAGNVVINKPSEVTSLISLKFHDVLMEAGIPDGVAQVLVGYGDVGAELIGEADFVCFTGSVATGRKVAMVCAERLIPCTLELGGKDPAIVLEDADIERSANGIVWGAFMNAGQACTSVERVYVVEDVYDRFVETVVEKTRRLRQGIDTDYSVEQRAMTFPKQLAIVEDHVADAVEKGATVLTGGRRHPDFPSALVYEPTVLTDVTHDMKVMKEETFGPVLPIMKVRDGEEALLLANDSEYGLNSSVWTRDVQRGRAYARRLEVGSACINETIVNYLAVEAPFGGVKHSGLGRRKGPAEIRKYCSEKTVLEDIFQTQSEPVWFPYSRKFGARILTAMRLLYRSGVGNKLRSIFGGD